MMGWAPKINFEVLMQDTIKNLTSLLSSNGSSFVGFSFVAGDGDQVAERKIRLVYFCTVGDAFMIHRGSSRETGGLFRALVDV